MPSLGAGMDVGRVLEWYVHPGDEVHRGDVVALVETDKAAIEVEVFEDGVVSELLVEEGTRVPVGTAIATLGDEVPTAAPARGVAAADDAETPASPVARDVPAHRPAAARAHTPSSATTATPVTRAPTTTPAGNDGRRRVSPYARRLAAEQGRDLGEVTGSGPGGAVIARDLGTVQGVPPPASRTAPSAPPAQELTPAETMRQAIGRAMAQSKREIPHYYLGHAVDLEDTLRWLEARNADRPPSERVLPAVLVLRAVALACREHPGMNGTWDGRFVPAEAVHVGVAVALRGGGLVAPAIHDTDTRTLDELMAALADVVQRARAGRLRSSELADPTITVTNLGDRGVRSVLGVIVPPQVALVGTGRIERRPWVVDDRVEARRVMELTLSADHRASDGHRGALFLDDIARRLQEPEEL
jgi:pyruvate dehydrogenase E2 component (dihydrolipoamide acetyltransferase)